MAQAALAKSEAVGELQLLPPLPSSDSSGKEQEQEGEGGKPPVVPGWNLALSAKGLTRALHHDLPAGVGVLCCAALDWVGLGDCLLPDCALWPPVACAPGAGISTELCTNQRSAVMIELTRLPWPGLQGSPTTEQRFACFARYATGLRSAEPAATAPSAPAVEQAAPAAAGWQGKSKRHAQAAAAFGAVAPAATGGGAADEQHAAAGAGRLVLCSESEPQQDVVGFEMIRAGKLYAGTVSSFRVVAGWWWWFSPYPAFGQGMGTGYRVLGGSMFPCKQPAFLVLLRSIPHFAEVLHSLPTPTRHRWRWPATWSM